MLQSKFSRHFLFFFRLWFPIVSNIMALDLAGTEAVGNRTWRCMKAKRPCFMSGSEQGTILQINSLTDQTTGLVNGGSLINDRLFNHFSAKANTVARLQSVMPRTVRDTGNYFVRIRGMTIMLSLSLSLCVCLSVSF